MDILVRDGHWWRTYSKIYRWGPGPEDTPTEDDYIIERHTYIQSVYSYKKRATLQFLNKPIQSVWVWEYVGDEPIVWTDDY